MTKFFKALLIVFFLSLSINMISQENIYVFINKYDTLVNLPQGNFQCIKIEFIKKIEGTNYILILWDDIKGNSPSVRYFSPLLADFCFSERDSLFYLVIFHREAFTFWKIKPDGSTNIEYKAAIKASYEENVKFIRENTLRVDEQIIRLSDFLKLRDVKLSIAEDKLITTCYTENKKIIKFTYNLTTHQWEILENRKLTEEELKSLTIY